MENFRNLVITMVLVHIFYMAYSQCENTSAGLFCDPGIPNGAPLLCDLDCLDGFTARMPQMDSVLLESQPENLCRNGSGNQGDANNLSWFAFVAGSSDILFRITPSNCTVEGNNLTGIQAGIYSKCYTWEEVICFGDCYSNAFEIGGDLFTPGETYFFFIDGCNGSVCDYTVDVLRGSQPYPLPDIDTLMIDSPSDTLCTNIETTITTVGLVQDSIQYNYTISPATSDYPTGRHPDTLSSETIWRFSEPGTYTICVEATNGCDITPEYCQEIIVRDLAPEIFTDVTICMEELPAYRGPDMEDPNGDGVIGWQGGPFFTPGLNIDTIRLSNGCYYTQEINVNLLPINSREDVNLFACTGDFPFDYLGFTVTGPIDNFSVSLDNQAANGCDSLINLTVREVVFEGGIILSDCANGQGVLSLEIVDFPLAASANLDIVWRDPMGTVLPDNGNPLERIATTSGIYEVDVIININGFVCTYLVQSQNIDLNNLVPGSPQIFQKDSVLCEMNEITTYKVISSGSGDEVFTWAYPNGVRVISETGDSLVIDWQNIAGGQVCVTVSNSCGMSLPTCFNVVTEQIAVPELISDSVACVSDTIEFYFIGDPNGYYSWTINAGYRVSSIDSNGVGPHQLVVDDEVDSLEILFYADNGFCLSDEMSKVIYLKSPLDTPMVYCTATDNTVLFQWNEIMDAVDYQITVLTGNTGTINGNTYLVENLMPDDIVTISIRALSDLACAHSEEVSFTCRAGCDPVDFSISVTDTFLCVGNDVIPITIDQSDLPSSQVEIVGMGVVDDRFNAENLSPGIYDIVGIFSQDGCQYVDNVSIEIGGAPSYVLNTDGPYCPQDETGTLSFILEEGGSVLFEGELLPDLSISVPPGNYNFEVIGENGCRNLDNIVINMPQIPGFSLPGLFVTDQGNSVTIPVSIGSFDTSRIIEVIWFDEGGSVLCSGDYLECGRLEYIPADDGMVCADILYDGNCLFTLCTEINLRRIVNIYTPDIFTPNQDGINDDFIFLSNQRDVVVEGFYIFNRWGELMHSITNIPIESEAASWDGNYKGKPAAEGVYVYVIQYISDGKKLTKKGDITLLR